jgi:ABC-type multidrug transport system ATPase subunit
MGDRLTAEDIYFTIRGAKILDGCAITSSSATITALVGRNGAGKSTLLTAVYGIIPSESLIHINGKLIDKIYARPGLINYLPQKSFLKNKKLFRIIEDYEIDWRILCDLFPEFKEYFQANISELSLGMGRLFITVVTLLQNTRFTILDEPFLHLSPVLCERLTDLILSIKKKKGIIITDHQYKIILGICDEIYFMESGKTTFIKHKELLNKYGYYNF